MPPPTDGPWTSGQMPWSNSSYAGVMQFTAASNFAEINHKRKSNLEPLYPLKQHITEEKMAATLNGLHISHDFVAHNSNIATERNLSDHSVEGVMDSDVASKYPLCSSKDLEEKLRRAKHITLCEQFKNIQNNESIIPKALLEHYEKPCKALVIWQPPPKMKELVSSDCLSYNRNKVESEDNSKENNMSNKCSNIDLNNITMETDIF